MKYWLVRLMAALLLLSVTHVQAHDYTLKGLRIGHPYAIPTVPAQTNGAAYLALENAGKDAVRLVGASSPIAVRVELHHMAVEQNVARMREVKAIDVKPGESLKMVPGMGLHIMLVGIKAPLKEGDKFPLWLDFAQLGTIEVSVFVQKSKEGAESHSH